MGRLGNILLAATLSGGLAAGLVGCGGGDGPEVPPVPDTFVVEGTSRLDDPFGDLELESRELPEDAVLVGADYEVALSRYGVATELTEEAVRELALRGPEQAPPWLAGKGREFLLLHLTEPEQRKRPLSNRFPKVMVLVDGVARELDGTALLPRSVVVVSVPAGADATLAVNEGGNIQSISIRTGKLVGPSPQPVAPKPSSTADQPATPSDRLVASGTVRLTDYVAVPRRDPGLGWDALVDVAVEVELRGYDEKLGAARPGMLWARVTANLHANPTRVKFKIDLSRSLTIRTAAGQALRVPAGTSVTVPAFSSAGSTLTVPVTWSEAFQVPAKTRKFSVTYRTRATVTADDGRKEGFERRDTRNSGTITLK
ncbi:hypothetical protein O7626_36255 [Micromonospora sp. WMMD1102]|uniref:hypothetical protein n=1 Tax=Micromonospora sp. WMMD1102 TaxID=3016105 RepID=UPI0024151651|nr:hypothetical protein [Micromonospora sp. WMMD1102]MDG4791285.1 hypothetical protein [Micromonospora sp. WMMD1102]